MSYHHYHPLLVFAFHEGFLPGSICKQVPASTKQAWKKKNLNHCFGHNWTQDHTEWLEIMTLIAENKRLLQINRSLLKLILLVRLLKKSISPVHFSWFASQIDGLKQSFSLAFLCKSLEISPYQLQQFRLPICGQSIFNKCLQTHPGQLLNAEIKNIKSYLEDQQYLHWPLSSIFAKMKREGKAWFGISTFYKYAKALNISRTKAKHLRKNHTTGIRAVQALEILHADTSRIRLADNTVVWMYIVQDNFSRAILSFRVALKCKAETMKDCLQEATNNWIAGPKTPFQLITDDGSENKGEVLRFIKTASEPQIKHLIAQKDILSSNSMIEACHKQLKYFGLYFSDLSSFAAAEKAIAQEVEAFNNRPRMNLGYATPLEILTGKPPDLPNPKTYLQARKNRYTQNGKPCCAQV